LCFIKEFALEKDQLQMKNHNVVYGTTKNVLKIKEKKKK